MAEICVTVDDFVHRCLPVLPEPDRNSNPNQKWSKIKVVTVGEICLSKFDARASGCLLLASHLRDYCAPASSSCDITHMWLAGPSIFYKLPTWMAAVQSGVCRNLLLHFFRQLGTHEFVASIAQTEHERFRKTCIEVD